jgi:hypothetical protein
VYAVLPSSQTGGRRAKCDLDANPAFVARFLWSFRRGFFLMRAFKRGYIQLPAAVLATHVAQGVSIVGASRDSPIGRSVKRTDLPRDERLPA